MTKLPFKFRDEWRTKAHDILERYNHRACFNDLVWNGPYAVRTVLGWVVNGPLRGGENSKPKTGFSVAAVNRISVCKLEVMLNNQYNHDFNERSTEGKAMGKTSDS